MSDEILQRPPRWLGLLHLTVGLVICVVATGLIPIDETKLHAPRGILFLAGLVFVSGGLMVLTYGNRTLTPLLMAVICASLGSVALWVSLYGFADHFSGNLPTSPENQVSIARIAFGIGGAICYLAVVGIAVQALRRKGP